MWFMLLTAAAQAPAIEYELYRTQIAAAESAMRLGEIAVARAWLDATSPALRGFEWRVHEAALDESLEVFPIENARPTTIAVHPDGSSFACGLSSGAVVLLDPAGGASIAALGSHSEGVAAVRFDATGARLVSSSWDRTVKVWDVAARGLALELQGHGFPVGGAAFSPDGRWIATCSYERPEGAVVGTVRLWDAADGRLARTLEGGRKPLVAVEFSPDGRRVAAASWDFCVFVWNVEGGEPVRCAVPDEGIYNAVDGVAWSPDGTLVAGASKDRTARVWRAGTGELAATLRGHTDHVSKLRFAPDGATLATASHDGTVRLWSVEGWKPRSTLRGHADDVRDLAFTPDGGRIFTCSSDRTVRTWDARTEWYGGNVMTAGHAAYVARFSPDDARIASASYDGRIQLWNADTLEPEASWQAHPEDKSCHALAWTADGRRLVSGSWEPVVRVWDVETRSEVAAFEQPAGTSHVSTSPTGGIAASCSGSRVFVWDLEARARIHEFAGHSRAVMAANFSPDGRSIVSTGRDGRAIVWEARSGATAFSIEAAGQDVAEARFTPDGTRIVVASRGGTVTLHAASDGARQRELVRHRHGIQHIDISPDGTRVALASDTIVLLDLAHGAVVGQLRPHVERPYNLDFDSSGQRLASCSTDKTLAVSDARPLRDRLRARSAAQAAAGR